MEESDSEENSTDEDRPIARPLPEDWTDQLTPSVIEDFVDNVGPTTILSGDKREIDFFQLLFPENLFSLTANETNEPANMLIKHNRRKDKTIINGIEWTRKKSRHSLGWEFTWAL